MSLDLPPPTCENPQTPAERPLALTARIHLLLVLLEDSLRREVTYTPEAAHRWNQSIGPFSEAIKPLSRYNQRARAHASNLPTDVAAPKIAYAQRQLNSAILAISNINPSIVSRLFSALDHVRHARVCIRILITDLLNWSGPRNAWPMWNADDFQDIENSLGPLRSSFFGLSAKIPSDDATQCNRARNAYLACYYTATFGDTNAHRYHYATLEFHRHLLGEVIAGVLSDCIAQRLRVLEAITPDDFEMIAIQMVSSPTSSTTPSGDSKQWSTR